MENGICIENREQRTFRHIHLLRYRRRLVPRTFSTEWLCASPRASRHFQSRNSLRSVKNKILVIMARHDPVHFRHDVCGLHYLRDFTSECAVQHRRDRLLDSDLDFSDLCGSQKRSSQGLRPSLLFEKMHRYFLIEIDELNVLRNRHKPIGFSQSCYCARVPC